MTKPAPSGTTTVFHYDLDGLLLAETTEASNLIRVYFWAEDMPIAQMDTELTYLHADHLDTPRIGTNSSGAIVWQWSSDAFGSLLPNEDPDNNGTPTTVNLRFPGQYFDKETSLHYNYFRDYDPRIGRYLESDPIGLKGGINTYGYVEGNPLSKVDPTGEIAFVPVLIGIGVGIAFDYGGSEWKKKNCSCPTASTPAGAVGNGAAGAANGVFGDYASKPRTGIAGGGKAGSRTSVYSQVVSEAYQSGAISVGTRRVLRDAGRFISGKLPYASAAFAAYEINDAFNCD